MPIIRKFEVRPGLVMSIDLVFNGTALLYFEGAFDHNGKAVKVKGDVACSSSMNSEDMNDLEAAIRGDEEAARSFADRILVTYVERVVDGG